MQEMQLEEMPVTATICTATRKGYRRQPREPKEAAAKEEETSDHLHCHCNAAV